MDDKDYITRFEYDERQKRIDDENNRQNHRLDKLETITDQIADMAASIKAMVVTMQAMQKEQEEQGKRLADIEKKYENGELLIHPGYKTARWISNGNYIPMHCLEILLHSRYAYLVDAEAHKSALDEQTTESINRYKKSMKNHVYTEEELDEMRNAFGEGHVIVNVITGEKITL